MNDWWRVWRTEVWETEKMQETEVWLRQLDVTFDDDDDGRRRQWW